MRDQVTIVAQLIYLWPLNDWPSVRAVFKSCLELYSRFMQCFNFLSTYRVFWRYQCNTNCDCFKRELKKYNISPIQGAGFRQWPKLLGWLIWILHNLSQLSQNTTYQHPRKIWQKTDQRPNKSQPNSYPWPCPHLVNTSNKCMLSFSYTGWSIWSVGWVVLTLIWARSAWADGILAELAE